jgi:hypothetical protein
MAHHIMDCIHEARNTIAQLDMGQLFELKETLRSLLRRVESFDDTELSSYFAPGRSGE